MSVATPVAAVRPLDRADPVGAEDGGRRPPRRAFLREVGLCLTVGVVLTAIIVPFWGLTWGTVVAALIVNTVMSLGIGLSVDCLYRWVYPWAMRRWTGWIARGLVHLVLLSAAAFGGGEIALRVLGALGWSIDEMRATAFQIGIVVVTVVVAFSIAFERLKERARVIELREHEARQKALRAQLDALQARTDPHFLFNTLNTVAGLIEEDPRMAERMLERLSSVFRFALTGSRSPWVRLDAELQAVRDYLAVEQIRFGDRLSVDVDVAADADDPWIPPLVLQPLVENAVLHGVASSPGPGRITVAASRDGDAVVLRVEDDGPGPGASRHRGSGTALANLRERLALVYGDRASLEAGAGPDGGYRATLRLPVGEPAS